MKLAFSGEARYPDFNDGYELYKKRTRSRDCMDLKTYKKVVRMFCSGMEDKLLTSGLVDFPNRIGFISAAIFTRKAKYRDGKMVGFGKMDWEAGHYDGSMKAFGVAFFPRRDITANMRCYGFVCNRELYKKMAELYNGYDCPWVPLEFSDDMI